MAQPKAKRVGKSRSRGSARKAGSMTSRTRSKSVRSRGARRAMKRSAPSGSPRRSGAQGSKQSETEMRKPSDEQVRNIRPRPEPKPRRAQQRRARKAKHFPAYAVVDPKRIPDGPDVLVDVPVAKVDEVDVEVDDLRAQVAVMAEVRKILMLSVGADAKLGQVELKIEGVEAQALLKARLKNVHAIVERVALTLDRNPELLAAIGRGV
jgi:hypothetical protein